MDWDEGITVERVDQRRFCARIDESWTALQGVNGGIVAAVCLAAAQHVLADEGVDPTTTLRSATLGYVSGTDPGDVEVDVEVVRRGRSLVTTHVRAAQAGKPTVVARFHHSTPWDGAQFSDAPARLERPAGAQRLDGPQPVHITKVETDLDPATPIFGGTEAAELRAWSRPLHGPTFDSTWLVMFGDYLPPSVFTRTTAPSRAVTVEYSMQVHSAAGSWTLGAGEQLSTRARTFHSHDGFAVEDGWIHLPDGSLLATTRQVRLAG